MAGLVRDKTVATKSFPNDFTSLLAASPLQQEKATLLSPLSNTIYSTRLTVDIITSFVLEARRGRERLLRLFFKGHYSVFKTPGDFFFPPVLHWS